MALAALAQRPAAADVPHAPAGAAPPARPFFDAPYAGAPALPPVRPPAVGAPAPGAALAGLGPAAQCLAAARSAAAGRGIPGGLLEAIARVETGRADGHGGVAPWPWSINVEGADHVFDSKAEAIAAVRGYQAAGIRSIDVGCLQVNLMHHPDAFDSLEAAFDPVANARYAAGFLRDLFDRSGSWERATALYHSATPGMGEPYQQKVAAAWRDGGGATGPLLALPGGPGAIMLGNHADTARILAAPPGSAGRGLDAYRAAPISVARIFTNPHLP